MRRRWKQSGQWHTQEVRASNHEQVSNFKLKQEMTRRKETRYNILWCDNQVRFGIKLQRPIMQQHSTSMIITHGRMMRNFQMIHCEESRNTKTYRKWTGLIQSKKEREDTLILQLDDESGNRSKNRLQELWHHHEVFQTQTQICALSDMNPDKATHSVMKGLGWVFSSFLNKSYSDTV